MKGKVPEGQCSGRAMFRDSYFLHNILIHKVKLSFVTMVPKNKVPNVSMKLAVYTLILFLHPLVGGYATDFVRLSIRFAMVSPQLILPHFDFATLFFRGIDFATGGH